MQICEYFFENACYSVTKYYLCKQNNRRSLLGRKQRSQVARSFPNRYQFSYTNKVTSLFSVSCILDIILPCKNGSFALQKSHFRNAKSKLPFFVGIIFTKQGLFSGFAFDKKQEIELHNILMLNLMFVFFLKCGKLHFRTFYVGYT